MSVMQRPRRRSHAGEAGATLVEFAIALPLLLALLIGIVEFGWMFARNVDVDHGTREGARLAAVNFPERNNPVTPGTRSQANTDALVSEICSRLGLAGQGATISVTSAGEVEDPVTVTVTAPGTTLTGFLDWAFPNSLQLTATATSRVEQPATWSNTAVPQSC